MRCKRIRYASSECRHLFYNDNIKQVYYGLSGTRRIDFLNTLTGFGSFAGNATTKEKTQVTEYYDVSKYVCVCVCVCVCVRSECVRLSLVFLQNKQQN